MEKWKSIKGYEGLYEISNLGRVKRLPREKKLNGGNVMMLDEVILRTKSTNTYPSVALNNGVIRKTFTIHRLVATYFIHNDDPIIKREVNHLDKDINNFSIDNLEWCTRSENMLHAKKKHAKK